MYICFDDCYMCKQEMAKHKTLKRMTVLLFGVILCLFFAVRSGSVTFIHLFVTKHLGASEDVGNFLISAYFGGEVLYRLVVGFCLCDCMKQKMRSPWFLLFAHVVLVLFLLLWAAVAWRPDYLPYEAQIAVMFVVFCGSGLASSTTYPAVYELCEAILPISGFVAGAFTICLGLGDVLIVLVMGELVELFGVSVQPTPLVALCVVQIGVIGITAALFRKYKAYEATVLVAIPSGDRRKHQGLGRQKSYPMY